VCFSIPLFASDDVPDIQAPFAEGNCKGCNCGGLKGPANEAKVLKVFGVPRALTDDTRPGRKFFNCFHSFVPVLILSYLSYSRATNHLECRHVLINDTLTFHFFFRKIRTSSFYRLDDANFGHREVEIVCKCIILCIFF
jgi:hypothetical protein